VTGLGGGKSYIKTNIRVVTLLRWHERSILIAKVVDHCINEQRSVGRVRGLAAEGGFGIGLSYCGI